MTYISRLKGMRFPDTMVTRFFYKNKLDQKKGTVLELGCGNANNLMLFASYGWDTIGLDCDRDLLNLAVKNFQLLGIKAPHLIHSNMNDEINMLEKIDVLLLPSSIYYVDKKRAIEILLNLKPLLNTGGLVYCQFRTPRDYRYLKGQDLGMGSYLLNIRETNEFGLINTFYEIDEMKKMLQLININVETIKTLRLSFESVDLNGKVVMNDDIIMYGFLN